MKPKTYTPKQTAEILKITKNGVIKKIHRHEFPNAKMCECGTCWLIPESDITKSK